MHQAAAAAAAAAHLLQLPPMHAGLAVVLLHVLHCCIEQVQHGPARHLGPAVLILQGTYMQSNMSLGR
jgi:hypothetical protein